MKVLVAHPTGNSNVRMAVNSIFKNGMLAEFHTTVAITPESKWPHLLPVPVRNEFLRRSFNIKPSSIRSHPLREMGRIISSKLGLAHLYRHEKGPFSVDAVYQNFDAAIAAGLPKAVKHRNVTCVYAYEDGALATFLQAKKLNLITIYDLPIGYWRSAKKLLGAELDAWPEWAPTMKGFRDSTSKLERKDRELSLADHIFVASTFTKNTLKEYTGTLAPVTVIPYGFPPVADNRQYERIENRPLKLLFVGGLSQRKGIANVLAAVAKLGDRVRLTIVGKKPTDDCQPLNMALLRHRYIPSLPHHEILEEMKAHDLLLFPSLFEGFGLVITESMSQGTPVITTERTCGYDLIEHGRNGWLVPAGDTDALYLQILDLLDKPELLEVVGRAALHSAEKRPWEVYGQELIKNIREINI